MSDDEETFVPLQEYEPIEQLRHSQRAQQVQREYFESRGLTEIEYFQEVIDHIEKITGTLVDWQRFYIVAAISTRGVEWTQTRGNSHYHILGLPCAICGRR